MDEQDLRAIGHITGHKFADPALLEQAFAHASAVGDRLKSNERLEFLGDSVLAMVVCRDLYERFPECPEGELTKMKSSIVSRRVCARVARSLDLDRFMRVGKGTTNTRALSGSIIAGVMESLIAAIYLDGGLEAARHFVLRNFAEFIAAAESAHGQGNFKSILQEYAQQRIGESVQYELLDEKGPDHDKCFELRVAVGERRFASAWGSNKKEAEQKAALNALRELGLLGA
jgi:ribonuclease-3